MLYSFRYEAQNAKGEVLSGEIMAVDLADAKAKLKEQGLEVRNIHVELWKKPVAHHSLATSSSEKSPGEKEQPAIRNIPSWSRKAEEPVSYSSHALNGVYVFLAFGFLLVLGFVLFATFFSSKLGLTKINENIEFKVVKFSDLSEDDVLRREYTVVVPHGIKKEEVKFVAKKVYEREKSKLPKLEQAMLQFYYPDQDHNKVEPVALLLWNWEGSGKWDNTFSLIDEGAKEEKIQMVQGRVVKGDWVEYNAIFPTKISLDGAQRVAEEELAKVAGKWQGKVPRIKLQVSYQDFSKPFMKCEKSLPEKGSAPAAECEFVQ